ncbi:DgyrCDS7503 [Dimorphilus gyrociliatus]|uniref:DgyrCDS7503 n=1 Tax=Dimorphilus gyrociliatus TaxID=2664684 RepID=A0A7I8VTF9_9ANNE|nr:DgyrCDS7503 [Dimorphilus gyrociliatus]
MPTEKDIKYNQVCQEGFTFNYIDPYYPDLCIPCPYGFYKTGFHIQKCTPCPQGFTTNKLAALSISQCQRHILLIKNISDIVLEKHENYRLFNQSPPTLPTQMFGYTKIFLTVTSDSKCPSVERRNAMSKNYVTELCEKIKEYDSRPCIVIGYQDCYEESGKGPTLDFTFYYSRLNTYILDVTLKLGRICKDVCTLRHISKHLKHIRNIIIEWRKDRRTFDENDYNITFMDDRFNLTFACPAGYFLERDICKPCKAGHYQPRIGFYRRCLPCPPFYFSSGFASTSCSSCRSNGQYRNPKTVAAQTRQCLGEDINMEKFLDKFEQDFNNLYLPVFAGIFLLLVMPLTCYRLIKLLDESTKRAQEKSDYEIHMEKKDVTIRNEEIIAERRAKLLLTQHIELELIDLLNKFNPTQS